MADAIQYFGDNDCGMVASEDCDCCDQNDVVMAAFEVDCAEGIEEVGCGFGLGNGLVSGDVCPETCGLCAITVDECVDDMGGFLVASGSLGPDATEACGLAQEILGGCDGDMAEWG